MERPPAPLAMPLLTHIIRQHILISVLIFLFGGLLAYRLFKAQVTKETDYSLRGSVHNTVHLLEKGLPYNKLQTPWLHIQPIGPDSSRLGERLFSDTLAFHRPTQDKEWMRQLTTVVVVDGRWYEIRRTLVIFEERDVIRTVAYSLLWLFGGLTLALALSHYWLSRRLLQPFHHTLSAVRTFDLKGRQAFVLPRSAVREFDELNRVLNRLIERNQREYHALKEFSDNASHEMQTPLAIMRSKLDLLVQSPHLSEQDLELVNAVYASLDKLSRLGHALALLTKIENDEFRTVESTDLRPVVDKLIFGLEELIDLKNLRVVRDLEAAHVPCHAVLADVLVINLLQNAIRHNQVGGDVHLTLHPGLLRIANSSEGHPLDEQNIFRRFQRDRRQQASLGLGLAIVKKICDVHGFDLQYHFEAGLHVMTIHWTPSGDLSHHSASFLSD
mgnify:CR=1 FL=1